MKELSSCSASYLPGRWKLLSALAVSAHSPFRLPEGVGWVHGSGSLLCLGVGAALHFSYAAIKWVSEKGTLVKFRYLGPHDWVMGWYRKSSGGLTPRVWDAYS